MNPQPTARQRKTKTGASSPPNVYYIYHWNRIIGAFAAVALLTGLAGFGFFAWLAPAGAPTDDAEIETALAPSAHFEPSSDIVAETTLMPAAQPEPSNDIAAEISPAPEPVTPDREAITPERVEREPVPATDEGAQSGALPPSEDETSAPIETVAPSGDETSYPIEAAPPTEDITPSPNAAEEPSGAPSSRVFLPPDTRVNLRAAPSLSSPVLRILDARADLQLLGTSDAFFQVRTDERIVGWVSRDHSSLRPYTTYELSGNAD